MPRTDFSVMPDSARLWVFAAARPLQSDERDALLAAVDGFLDEWHAHRVPLSAARDLRYDQFLLIAVDEEAAGVSGCSIDSLVRTVKALGRELGVELLDYASVFFRDQAGVQRVSRDAFADAASASTVTPDTIVFDNTVTSVGAVRQGRWETKASAAWHGRAFFEPALG